MRSLLPGPVFAVFLLAVATTVTLSNPSSLTLQTRPKRHFHFEFSNQFDLLQRSSFPSLKQKTATFELNYGLLDDLEIGIEVPLLTNYQFRDNMSFDFAIVGGK